MPCQVVRRVKFHLAAQNVFAVVEKQLAVVQANEVHAGNLRKTVASRRHKCAIRSPLDSGLAAAGSICHPQIHCDHQRAQTSPAGSGLTRNWLSSLAGSEPNGLLCWALAIM